MPRWCAPPAARCAATVLTGWISLRASLTPKPGASTRPEPAVWDGVLDATSYGYVCPLLEMPKPNGEMLVPHRYWLMDEACQNLNIWTPALDDAHRPVLVWLHGGGILCRFLH